MTAAGAPATRRHRPRETCRPGRTAARRRHHQRGGLLSLARPRLAAVLLGAACVAWSAAPLGHGGWPTVALTVAIIAVTAGGLRLALADVPEPEDAYFLSATSAPG